MYKWTPVKMRLCADGQACFDRKNSDTASRKPSIQPKTGLELALSPIARKQPPRWIETKAHPYDIGQKRASKALAMAEELETATIERMRRLGLRA